MVTCIYLWIGNIVFVCSQYDGGNTEQRTIGYGCCQNQEAKLKIVGGLFRRNLVGLRAN